LDAITLSESSVVGQARPVATIRLSAPAPSGNAPVFVESSNTDVAKVPANVSVAAGQTTNTFSIDTGTVRNATTVTISARYEGVTKTVDLTILPPPLSAQFSVTSVSRGSDACAIIDVTGRIDCVFDASGSTGFVATYFWTLSIAGKDFKLNIPEGTPLFTPTTDCSNLSGGSINSDGYENMRVTLRLEDRQGNSTDTVERIVKLYPNGRCGY
jgi:hypothetical protein